MDRGDRRGELPVRHWPAAATRRPGRPHAPGHVRRRGMAPGRGRPTHRGRRRGQEATGARTSPGPAVATLTERPIPLTEAQQMASEPTARRDTSRETARQPAEAVATPPHPFDPTAPTAARRYDRWKGGKDHFAADRRSADRIEQAFPSVRTAAVQNRG